MVGSRWLKIVELGILLLTIRNMDYMDYMDYMEFCCEWIYLWRRIWHRC